MTQTRIRILNWDKYNAKRADVKKPSWYREENTSAQSRSLYGIHATYRYVFHCLKGLASQEQTDDLTFEPDWFCDVAGARSFTLAEFDTAMELLDGRVLEVIEHEPSTLRARAADVTLRTDVRTNEESVAAPLSSPPPPEKNSKTDPVLTEADTAVLDPVRLVGDPELNAWLVDAMGCTRRGFDSWCKCPTQGGGDVVRLEAMLRAAQSKWNNDPRQKQKVQFTGAPRTGWLNSFLEIEAKKYTSSPAPPGGAAAVIPLSEPKAEKQVMYCGDCSAGWISMRRKSDGIDLSVPCKCTTKNLSAGGAE